MIVYKDRSFCARSASRECANQECYRAVTERDRESATRMGLPFGLIDMKNLDCGYQATEQQQTT